VATFSDKTNANVRSVAPWSEVVDEARRRRARLGEPRA
jgi:hypothetical protein